MSGALAISPALPDAQLARAREVIARHGKSFALASRLLPRGVRDEAVVLYAYCRRVDDAIDAVSAQQQPAALARLRAELDDVYAEAPAREPLLQALQALVRARRVPREYPEALLAGMAMDVHGERYPTLHALLGYAYRVAAVVGLMMCHVMGVRRPRALVRAAHLGIAMQLTNIARDVGEDWARGRLYLPDALLQRHGAGDLRAHLGGALPLDAAPAVARATAELLAIADLYYRSGEHGLADLSPRCALAVDAARLIYADIGRVVRARGCDPLAARAVVSTPRKLLLLAHAGARALRRRQRGRDAGAVALPEQPLPLETALIPETRP